MLIVQKKQMGDKFRPGPHYQGVSIRYMQVFRTLKRKPSTENITGFMGLRTNIQNTFIKYELQPQRKPEKWISSYTVPVAESLTAQCK